MSRPPVEFRILGHTELACSGGGTGGGVLRQPKRLALLAYLALDTADGHRRRDQLVALFWPELDSAHARGQLRKAIHALRASIGSEAFTLRGEEELRLDRNVVWCDAVEFRAMVEAKRWLDALELYRGDLLEGLYPGGVGEEFQSWLDAQRTDLRGLAASAAWAGAHALGQAGDRGMAALLARRALALRPDDEIGIRTLMRLLDESGDRAGALREYESWRNRLLREYGAEPDPETRRLARHVQAPRKGESQDASAEAASARALQIASLQPAADMSTGCDDPPPSPSSARPAPSPRRWLENATLRLAGAGFAAFLLGGAVMLLGVSLRQWYGISQATVAVLPLRTLDDSISARIGAGLSEELATSLARRQDITVRAAARVRSFPAVADAGAAGRALRVLYVFDGSVRGEDARTRVMLRMVRARDNVTVWARAFDVDASRMVDEQQRIAQLAITEVTPLLDRSAPARPR